MGNIETNRSELFSTFEQLYDLDYLTSTSPMSLCDKRYGALALAEASKTDRLRALVHGPFIALESLQDGPVPVGWKTNLKQSKDTPILTKQKNLNQVIANPRRESFENWLAALARAKKLRLRGYDVKLPPPHLGRPPFLLIKTPRS